jgi:preflagellin peptidase FlaK
MSIAAATDLVRLVAVPAFGWAAWRDVRTRRLPNRLWYPLGAVGVVALLVDAVGHFPVVGLADRLFFVRVGVSLLVVVPLAYGLWWMGGFGGADAKALMTLAVLFPTYPTFYVGNAAYPLVETTLGAFSLTVLTNAVVVGLAYPLYLGVRNALRGDLSPVVFLGRRVDVAALPGEHGRLFETTDGFTRRGLDVDALRMYLRWRGTSLADLRRRPGRHRDPESVGETNDPTGGAVDPEAVDARDAVGDPDAGNGERAGSEETVDDPWAAERFLAEIEGSAYGTTPETLREGLDVVTERETVWLSPGVPFLVPLFVGLCVGLVYGDLLFSLLLSAGVA